MRHRHLLRRNPARARTGTELVGQDVPGFEDLSVTSGRRWHARGTDGPNRVCGADGVPMVARTLGGEDHLGGSRRRDVLDGGAGHDTVYRTPGDDRLIDIETVRR